MGQQHIQTRVPDDLADQIDEYQESGAFMNRAEALRALLRAGLDAEGATDASGSDDPLASGEPAVLEKGYRFSKQLADTALAILMFALGGWFAVTLGFISASVVTTVTVVAFAVAGGILVVTALALTAILEAVRALANAPTPELRRFDIRRVVIS